jgi:hypothetical protein
MMKTSLCAVLMLVGVAGLAEAGGSPGTLGVGAEFQLTSMGGPSLNYDGGDFHVGGFLGYNDFDGDDNTSWALGGRFYYHIHSTTDADFGVGGSLGISSIPEMGGGGDSISLIFLEPGAQIRLFLAANVAFSAATGVVIGLSDAEGYKALSGSTLGSVGGSAFASVGFGAGVGLHYYFF